VIARHGDVASHPAQSHGRSTQIWLVVRPCHGVVNHRKPRTDLANPPVGVGDEFGWHRSSTRKPIASWRGRRQRTRLDPRDSLADANRASSTHQSAEAYLHLELDRLDALRAARWVAAIGGDRVAADTVLRS